jgi:hypothetical protein
MCLKITKIHQRHKQILLINWWAIEKKIDNFFYLIKLRLGDYYQTLDKAIEKEKNCKPIVKICLHEIH